MPTFKQIETACVSRTNDWLGGLDAWTIMEWAAAMCGEAGEAANVAKKIRRIDLDATHRKGEMDREELVKKLAFECADTLMYLLLICAKEGIDLEAAVVEKFNITSKEFGFIQRLFEHDIHDSIRGR